ncbi:hypothetical protein [Defluviimonas salinarum]|uniref:Uncharacterized protein n=1 Tax=Defluviimonas salinarum TaxID=2992147 RepID=A0ABT3J580_9RHOB|nr:hypothetical protein [Defluviimonas salinarum]MCW3782559.1 hypothetical protein [Defluviimonas salinarum]
MKKIILGACLSALAIGALPDSAAAWKATEATLQSTRNRVTETRDAVRAAERAINDGTDRLIAALKGHSGEQSAYQDKQIEANRRITDAAEQNATTRLRQEFRARAESGEFDPSPDSCLLAGAYRNGGGSGALRGSTTVAEARVQNDGGDPAVREGGTRFARSVVDDQIELAKGMGGFAEPTVNPAAILQNPTLTIETDEDRRAANRLVRNMTDPFPPRPVTEEELRTPEGVARAAARAVQKTRANAGLEAIAMVMNMKTEVGPATPWQPYIDDISNYNRPVGDQVSELQTLDFRTLRHYAPKPEVFHKRSALSEKQLLQEILDVMSVNTRLAYLQLELDSRTAIVQTQILSTLAN